MEINERVTNKIFNQGLKSFNSALPIKRMDILKNFTDEKINEAWDVFCKYIVKNYLSGKGTNIPKFGVFTFISNEVNLEGTTNQFQRDHKARKPVFIVSTDFLDRLKPGQHTSGGILYYTQKQNNSLNHVKINYAELAYSLGMKKEDCFTLLDNYIKYIADAICNNEFKSKEMPQLGQLILKNNILCVKFDEEIIEQIKFIPQKYLTTKKHVNLYMELNQQNIDNNSIMRASRIKFDQDPQIETIKNLPDVSQKLVEIRPKTSVITKVSEGAEKWMKNNLDIDLKEIEEEKNNYVNYEMENESSVKFINDFPEKPVIKAKILHEMNLSKEIIDAIYFHKGVLISELRASDISNTGMISTNEIMMAFVKTNIHKDLTSQLIMDILNIYVPSKTDKIDYMKLISYFLKDLKMLMDEKNINKSIPNMNKTSKAFFKSNTVDLPKLGNDQSSVVSNFDSKYQENQIKTKNIYEKKVEIDDVSKEIKTIKIIFDKIKNKNNTRMDQIISYNELANILREFSIVIPLDKINQILTFIEVNRNNFTLNDISNGLKKCKILASEVTTEEIISIFNRLKDILYTLGGESFFFNPQAGDKDSLSKKKFVSKLKSKEVNVQYSEEILETVFNFLTKTDRDMTLEEYRKHFQDTRKNILDEEFEISAINKINQKIYKMSVKPNEYYDTLLLKKLYRVDNNLSRNDFHRICNLENYDFSAEEIDFIFKRMDTKKDGVIDREEFLKYVTRVYNALFKIKDLIKNENLEIEDILHKMIINKNTDKPTKRFDLLNFKMKMRLLETSLSNELLLTLFNEMKEEGTNYVTLGKMIMEFDVYKRENFNENNFGIFRKNFIEHFRNKSDYYEVKSLCEKIDTFNNGLLAKIEFCNVLRKFSKDYEDEEIMKFLRISNLLYNNKVKYSEFLDFIYYNPKNDQFSEIISNLKNLYKECNNNVEALFARFTGEDYIKTIGKVGNLNLNSQNTRSLTINQMYEFIKKNYPQIKDLNKNIVCKLDLDLDGKISVEDINGIIERYIHTFFFKRENKAEILENNLYPSESIDSEKFKMIVKDIKAALKAKNLTELGFFNKLDSNKTGFITHSEFNKKIDEVINLAPGMKDKFFSFLDIRKLGLIDLDTFMKRFKEFKSSEVIAINNWDTEQWILNEFSLWLKLNHRVSENELFTALDYDSDGIIGPADFKKFLLTRLNFSNYDFNDFQLERTLQHISLTKNKNICLIDLQDFILKNKSKTDKAKFDSDLVQPAKNLKESKEWINNVFEKIGSYISENYNDIESFFNENSQNGKMSLENFQNYFKLNYSCLAGFNLTYDEIVTLFSALDGQKKTYVLLDDLKSKLGSFDFYTKMHLDIKNYISTSFVNGIAAFKYFMQKKSEENFNKEEFDKHYNKSEQNFNDFSEVDKINLTKSEIFEGLNNLFPKKYKKQTVLNYLKKNFKNIEDINFSEFNYVYFDDIKMESTLRKTITSIRNFKDKTMVPYKLNNLNSNTNAFNNMSKTTNDFRSKSVAKSDNFSTKFHSQLDTPFDEDSLEKIRRIIHASRFDFTNYFKMHELLSINGMVNTFEFKNMLKKMNIGITGLEIDQITAKAGKTRNGMISIKDFVRFLKNEDPNLLQFKKNISQFMGLLKQLVYKYYSNARLAFQFNDPIISKEIDFNKFKQFVFDLFEKDSRPNPNFALVKNAFEYIDIRKDGIIDLTEWLKAFTFTESALDLKIPSLQNNVKATRSYENSREIADIYYLLTRNKKQIKEESKKYFIKQSGNLYIHCDNFIEILSKMFPNSSLNNNKWKVLINIGDKDKNSLIDVDYFFNQIGNSYRITASHPKNF